MGTKDPAPFVLIVTPVALPPKTLPITVNCVVPHVLPVVLLSVRVGPLTQPHETSKEVPVEVQPSAFRTVMI